MKGIIFNYFEEFVTLKFGPDAFDNLLDECTLITQEPFVGPGTYPDEDMLTLVGKLCETKGIELPVALKLFGEFCFPKLADSMPSFVNRYTHPKPFLTGIESVIHTEVRKLYKDANTPVFDVEDTGPKSMKMVYRSKRKLCPFVEGLFDGVSKHFNHRLSYSQEQCCHKDSSIDFCTFQIQFER